MIRVIRRWAGVTAMVLTLAAAAHAQGLTGDLSGTVFSNDNLAVPGATVTVQGPALQGTRTVVTDQNGVYAVHALPPGTYEVTFELSGMGTKTERVLVEVGRTTTANTTLSPAGVNETITVTGEVTTAGLTSTQIGANFKQETINALPTSRTVFGISEIAPGLTNNTPNGGQVTISGGFAYDNLFMINGVDVADNLFGSPNDLFIEEAIEQTTVLTSGINAEYGRFSGGVINAVTKSGGNRFSGSFRSNLSNPSWTDETPFEESRGTHRSDVVNKYHEGTFGGPILRDRLWFFTAGRWQDTTTPTTLPTTGVQFDAATKNKRWELNGRGAIKPGHTIFANHIVNNTDATTVAFGTTIDAHSIEHPSYPNTLTVASYNGAFRNDLLVTFQASKQHFGFRNSGGSSTNIVDSPFVSIGVVRGSAPGRFYNAPYFDQTDPEDRDNRQFAGSVSYYRPTTFGTHDVKAGFEHFTSIRTGGNSQSATGYVMYSDYATSSGAPVFDANGYLVPVFVPGFSYLWQSVAVRGATLNTRTLSIYGQDNWTVNRRLSLNLGLRLEDAKSKATGGIIGVDTSPRLVPRLAATFDPAGSGRTVLQASYAHYSGRYQDVQVGVNSPVGNPNIAQFGYTGPAGQGRDFAPGFNPANYKASQGASFPTANIQLEPGLKSPITREFAASVGQQFGRASAKLTYTHRSYSGFIEDFIDNPTASGKVHVVFEGVDYGFQDISTYRNSDLPVRRYQGLLMQGNYRPSARLSVEGSWTVELQNEGNFEGEGQNTPGVSSLLGDYPELTVPERNFPVGRLDDFQRHKVRLWMIYSQGLGRLGSVDVSPMLRINSGLTYSLRAAGVPLSDIQIARDPGYATPLVDGTQTLYFGSRGSQSFKGFAVLDLSVNYSIPVFKSARPWIKGEVLNVTNNDKLIAWDTTITPDYDGPVDANGLPINYINGPNFGKATSTSHFPRWRPGQNGGRTYLVSFGARF